MSNRRLLGIAWAAFALANLVAMVLISGGDGGTVPFHFIWVSLTIVYGFTVWAIRPTAVILFLVVAATSAAILLEVAEGPTRPDELSEVPLMAAMFVAMVWHARRRVAAEDRAIRSREREREFIRDASHHLKTPVALARGYAELLRRELSTTSTDAKRLVGELDRMTKIVNDLLLLMDSDGKSNIQRRPVDLRELAVSLADRWNRTVDRRFLVEADASVWVIGDRERLECALNALLENASEATEDDSRIWITVSQKDGRATIRVIDCGRGISSGAAEHMFERFWSEREHHRRGCGLGLPIAKGIVEAHGGTIQGSHHQGRTVFTIGLPVRTTSDFPIREINDDLRQTNELTIAS
jgi:signal transduction histidine kinase